MSAGQESGSPIRENRTLLPAPLPPDEARGTLAAAAGLSTVGLRPPFDSPAAAFSSRLSRRSHLDCRARLSIKPLALAALEAQKNSKEWGKKSGAKRREAAREGWMPVAAEMAKDLRKQDPHISQEDLAFEIRAVWKDEHLKAPGTARLKQYIGELENLELLDRRVPKPKKPKK